MSVMLVIILGQTRLVTYRSDFFKKFEISIDFSFMNKSAMIKA